MIFTWQLNVTVILNGKHHQVTVDKLIISGHRPEKFYRVNSKKGTVDLIKHRGQWMICNGRKIPDIIIDAIGAGIEKALDGEV